MRNYRFEENESRLVDEWDRATLVNLHMVWWATWVVFPLNTFLLLCEETQNQLLGLERLPAPPPLPEKPWVPTGTHWQVGVTSLKDLDIKGYSVIHRDGYVEIWDGETLLYEGVLSIGK